MSEHRPEPATPARYDLRITHHRRDPIDYRFEQHGSSWLIDLDEVPRLPGGLRRLCQFASADHLGDPGASLRSNLDSFLENNQVRRPSKILMLANPRVLGYVFNPLSVFYCYDEQNRISHTVAEVRNTYGGRHSYLLAADESGHAEHPKLFYVSPFYPVDGHYTVRLPEPGARLSVTVTLHRQDERPFAAVLTGRRLATPASLWSALRSPLATRAVMFGIKRHGIILYLKGLRPFPRESRTAEQTADQAELSEAR